MKKWEEETAKAPRTQRKAKRSRMLMVNGMWFVGWDSGIVGRNHRAHPFG